MLRIELDDRPFTGPTLLGLSALLGAWSLVSTTSRVRPGDAGDLFVQAAELPGRRASRARLVRASPTPARRFHAFRFRAAGRGRREPGVAGTSEALAPPGGRPAEIWLFFGGRAGELPFERQPTRRADRRAGAHRAASPGQMASVGLLSGSHGREPGPAPHNSGPRFSGRRKHNRFVRDRRTLRRRGQPADWPLVRAAGRPWLPFVVLLAVQTVWGHSILVGWLYPAGSYATGAFENAGLLWPADLVRMTGPLDEKPTVAGGGESASVSYGLVDGFGRQPVLPVKRLAPYVDRWSGLQPLLTTLTLQAPLFGCMLAAALALMRWRGSLLATLLLAAWFGAAPLCGAATGLDRHVLRPFDDRIAVKEDEKLVAHIHLSDEFREMLQRAARDNRKVEFTRAAAGRQSGDGETGRDPGGRMGLGRAAARRRRSRISRSARRPTAGASSWQSVPKPVLGVCWCIRGKPSATRTARWWSARSAGGREATLVRPDGSTEPLEWFPSFEIRVVRGDNAYPFKTAGRAVRILAARGLRADRVLTPWPWHATRIPDVGTAPAPSDGCGRSTRTEQRVRCCGGDREMLIGYVSDERYVALADVLFEFLRDGRRFSTRSTAAGAVEAELAPGAYCVTFCKPGFGAKRIELTVCRVAVAGAVPVSTAVRRAVGLCVAQVGPGGAKVGVSRSFARGVQAFAVAVRMEERAGPQDRLVRRARPRRHAADHARRRLHADRRAVEQVRLCQPASQAARRGAGPIGALFFSREDRVGPVFLLPVDRRAAIPAGEDRPSGVEHHVERVQQFRRPQQLHPSRPVPADADGQRAAGAEAVHRSATSELRHGRLRSPLLRSARADQPRAGGGGSHRSHRGAGRLPRRAGRMEAPGMDGTRRVRLRLLRGDAIPFRPTRPRPLQGARS